MNIKIWPVKNEKIKKQKNKIKYIKKVRIKKQAKIWNKLRINKEKVKISNRLKIHKEKLNIKTKLRINKFA